MHRQLSKTRRRFYTTIVLSVLTVILFTWLVLQLFNFTTIGGESSPEELRQIASQSTAVSEYIESEKQNEAHFVSLASLIKNEEQDRLTTILIATSVVSIGLTLIIARFVTRRLMAPVVEAQQSQERFLQDAAHELRNPLAAMSLSLQEAERKQQSSKLIDTFRRQTNRLVRINEDLLYLETASKSEVVDLDLSTLLEEVLEDAQPVIHKKKIKLKTNIEAGAQKRMAAEDYVRLCKNIIENAIKYSSVGGEVAVELTKQKSRSTLVVADKGIGIPEEDQSSVGDRFFRASNTGKYPGTGLGLAIVQKTLNTYGGQMTIDSSKGKGTTVTIRL